MKFFIDFEASQYTQEIISIGCVAETGNTFYSLVHSRHKVGNFVTALTGITTKDLETAPDVDQVFDNFFFWLNNLCHGKKIDFICYGNCDSSFALNTLKNVKRSFFAQSALSILSQNMIDYADYIKAYFGLNKYISLVKVYQYYKQDDTIIQTHNALEDAIMLKFVYDKIQNGVDIQIPPFPEYMLQIHQKDKNGNVINTFYGFPQAAAWILEHQGMPPHTRSERVINKIKNASDTKDSYCGYFWEIVE